MAEHQDEQIIFPVATFKDNAVTVKDEEGHIIGSHLVAILFPSLKPHALPNKKTTHDVVGHAYAGTLEYGHSGHAGTKVYKRIVCTKGADFDHKKPLTATVGKFAVTIKEDGTHKIAIFKRFKPIEKEADEAE